jgi:hypothetical protein
MQLPDHEFRETEEEMPHEDYYGVKVIACGNCGGKSFEVGSGDYVTLVRCVACRAVALVHSG